MQLELSKDCAQLTQIGKSNNSHIYKQLNKSGQALSHVVKLIIHPQPGQHQKECAHLQNEHSVLTHLSHEHIIGVKANFHANKCLKKVEFCAIELELGEIDLFDKMSTIYPQVLTPKELRVYFTQILSSVQYLHARGITHNDIKLENIFLSNGHATAKLADFGFAREKPHTSAETQRALWLNRCKTMLAPETLQLIRSKLPTKVFDETKTDIFALGITLF